ncbi:hypothetical protein Goari_016439 [Gossypium aridum]|uniref:Uncharacterized protein n=1 Tax=Gossypium aridum TaxID=34290 RepID=A0A7J8WJT6_GOSAI|nr:hypothetical protein [Gossypium aridum]
MDYLYSNPILLLAPCSLHLRLLSWHGLDCRQSRSLPRAFSFLRLVAFLLYFTEYKSRKFFYWVIFSLFSFRTSPICLIVI